MKTKKIDIKIIIFFILSLTTIYFTYNYLKFVNNKKNIIKKILNTIVQQNSNIKFIEKMFSGNKYFELSLNNMRAGYIILNSINKFTEIPQEYILLSPDYEIFKIYSFIHNIKDILENSLTNFNSKTISNIEKEKIQKLADKIKFSNEKPFKIKDGIYTGISKGVKGIIKTEIVIKNHIIQEIKFVEEQEHTYPAGKQSLKIIPDKIIKTQNLEVDAVSGATVTSNAIIKSIKNALTLE
jgi:uncharacterized protein with FMN-binding domain